MGEPKKLRKWSRGHQFVVRAGGHIDTYVATSIHVSTVTEDIIYNTIQIPYMTLTYVFTFLLRSESPSQVFFILLHWLATLSKPPDEKITLAYDNMCNLDRLRVAQNVLPLPPPMDSAWLNLEKIIDSTYYIFPITWKNMSGKVRSNNIQDQLSRFQHSGRRANIQGHFVLYV